MARISQNDAHQAALLAVAPIDKKLTKAKADFSAKIGSLYSAKLPEMVKKAFATMPEYMFSGQNVYIKGDGIGSRYSDRMDKPYPRVNNSTPSMELNKAEAKAVVALIDKVETLKEKREKALREIENTILALGTHKRVETDFPEAFPFLPGTKPTNTAVMLSIQPVRDTVKEIQSMTE